VTDPKGLKKREGPLFMGVVNVTPDSFSDGGKFVDVKAAVAHGVALWRAGADVLDVGGEATNPKATSISADEECGRVLPVIESLAQQTGAIISVDTTKAAVAKAAVGCGARMVNDISGGRFDGHMLATISGLPEVAYIAGHLRGSSLREVFADEEAPCSVDDVCAEMRELMKDWPVDLQQRTWIDPCLGFGKGGDVAKNMALLRGAGQMAKMLGLPVLIGASRKRFLRNMVTPRISSGAEPTIEQLDGATVAASILALTNGASMVRVHNVALLRAAWTVYTTK
jgi:dihydropteroate synthase